MTHLLKLVDLRVLQPQSSLIPVIKYMNIVHYFYDSVCHHKTIPHTPISSYSAGGERGVLLIFLYTVNKVFTGKLPLHKLVIYHQHAPEDILPTGTNYIYRISI